MKIKSLSADKEFYFNTCDCIVGHKKGDHKFVYLNKNKGRSSYITLSDKESIVDGENRKTCTYSKTDTKHRIPKLIAIHNENPDEVSQSFKDLLKHHTGIVWDEKTDVGLSYAGDLKIVNAKIYNVVAGVEMKEDVIDVNNEIDVWFVPSLLVLAEQMKEIRAGVGGGVNFLGYENFVTDPSVEHRQRVLDRTGGSTSSKEVKGTHPDIGSRVKDDNWKEKDIKLENVKVEERGLGVLVESDLLKDGKASIGKSAIVLVKRTGGDFCDVYIPSWLFKKVKREGGEI